MYDAWNGVELFEGEKPFKDIRVLKVLTDQASCIVTLAKSPKRWHAPLADGPIEPIRPPPDPQEDRTWLPGPGSFQNRFAWTFQPLEEFLKGFWLVLQSLGTDPSALFINY
jgi:hypothetical protein